MDEVQVIWVLTWWSSFEDSEVLAVFSSESSAMDFRQKHADAHDELIDNYRIDGLILDRTPGPT